MPEMDARRLRMLHAVSLRGSVTAAAASLNVSPSAVSQQLALLEREAGCDLVERAGRGITLTLAGHALAIEAERVLHALDRAEAAVAAARHGVSGTVRVGAFPSAAGAIAAPAAGRAQLAHPGLRVEIHEGEDGASLLDLRLTALDIVISQEYDHVPVNLPEGLTVQRIAADPLHLVVPAKGPLARLRGLAVGELREAPWVAAPPDSPCGRSTRQACRNAGFEPDIRHQALDFALTLDVVAAGLAVALVPGLGLRYRPAGVRSDPVRPVLQRTIYAVARSAGVGPQRPAVAAVLAELAAASI
jgi:DNA-binding transcriptional LysR family regulator